MSYRKTEADLVTYLRTSFDALGDDPDRSSRIARRLGPAGVKRNLAKAKSDLDGDWGDFAIEPVEESLYWMGECIALAYDYKIQEGTGHRWKALEVIKLYIDAFLPALSPIAADFHAIGHARNDRKYTETPVDLDKSTRWYGAVCRVWAAFEPDFKWRASTRRVSW